MHLEKNIYRSKINSFLNDNVENVYFYWKGRVALYAILKAIGLSQGDEVILPAFTCVVVPNAIIYLGAKPIYVDIDNYTLNPTLESIQQVVTLNTKVIICQNTFGLSSQVNEIAEWGKRNNIYTIEDCTHGFGGTFKNKPNGTYSDAAFFSTQWNKPFSTGIGGFALIKNKQLTEKIEIINKDLISPSLKDSIVLSMLLFVRKNLLTVTNYWNLLKIYRWLSKYNLIIGSSSGEEIQGIKMPKHYFKGICHVQEKEGIKSIQQLPELLKKRKINAKRYTDFLKSKDKYHVKEYLFANHSFLKYPLLVKDRKLFQSLAEESQIELGDWFCSPLHPVKEDLDVWNLDLKHFPIADSISKKIVNLPTDTNDVDKVLKFLNQQIDNIE